MVKNQRQSSDGGRAARGHSDGGPPGNRTPCAGYTTEHLFHFAGALGPACGIALQAGTDGRRPFCGDAGHQVETSRKRNRKKSWNLRTIFRNPQTMD
jgi:hypothetical protein